MVETEFSVVRFHGDQERADNVYANMTPLTLRTSPSARGRPNRPAHVNIDEIVIKPLDQAACTRWSAGRPPRERGPRRPLR